jgi:hypothetical protein
VFTLIQAVGIASGAAFDPDLTFSTAFTNGGSWPDVPDSVVGCVACQFDRQVCGIESEFA